MTTVLVRGEHRAVEDWLSERQRLGLDRHDEVWQGVYHVAPHAPIEHGVTSAEIIMTLGPYARRAALRSSAEFNLGEGKHDYRVPDGAWIAEGFEVATYVPTADVVLEVLSPDDETWDKFGFYAVRGVGEILVAHPGERWVRCWRLTDGSYEEVDASRSLGISTSELVALVRWL